MTQIMMKNFVKVILKKTVCKNINHVKNDKIYIYLAFLYRFFFFFLKFNKLMKANWYDIGMLTNYLF